MSCTPSVAGRAGEVVVSARGSALLMQLVCIEFFEEVSFLPLVVADVESVACQVLSLPVEIFHHRQRIIVRALRHSIPVSPAAAIVLPKVTLCHLLLLTDLAG